MRRQEKRDKNEKWRGRGSLPSPISSGTASAGVSLWLSSSRCKMNVSKPEQTKNEKNREGNVERRGSPVSLLASCNRSPVNLYM